MDHQTFDYLLGRNVRFRGLDGTDYYGEVQAINALGFDEPRATVSVTGALDRGKAVQCTDTLFPLARTCMPYPTLARDVALPRPVARTLLELTEAEIEALGIEDKSADRCCPRREQRLIDLANVIDYVRSAVNGYTVPAGDVRAFHCPRGYGECEDARDCVYPGRCPMVRT